MLPRRGGEGVTRAKAREKELIIFEQTVAVLRLPKRRATGKYRFDLWNL
jgi:hypothetical protein